MVKTESFDAAHYLGRPESQEELLNDALASGDAGYVAEALGVIARAGNERRGAGGGCHAGGVVPRVERNRRSAVDDIARGCACTWRNADRPRRAGWIVRHGRGAWP